MRRAWAIFLFFALGGIAFSAGCADRTYDRVRLGLAPSEYDRTLNTQQSSRTEIGLVEYARDADGDAGALILLLADDRRIAGKIRVTRAAEREFDLHLTRTGYELRGEIDPRLYGTSDVGPVDLLRLISQRLCEFPTERNAQNGHMLAVAGLIRVLERQPNVEDVGVPADRRRELAMLAPADGVVRMALDADGILRFGYTHGQVR